MLAPSDGAKPIANMTAIAPLRLRSRNSAASLVGRDAFQIRHFLQIAFDDYAQRRGSLEYYCAASGIEQALWDILGKATGQPVYNLRPLSHPHSRLRERLEL